MRGETKRNPTARGGVVWCSTLMSVMQQSQQRQRREVFRLAGIWREVVTENPIYRLPQKLWRTGRGPLLLFGLGSPWLLLVPLAYAILALRTARHLWRCLLSEIYQAPKDFTG